MEKAKTGSQTLIAQSIIMVPSQEYIEFNITKQLIPSQNIGSLTYSASIEKLSKDSLPSPFLFGQRRLNQEIIDLCSIEKAQISQKNQRYPFKIKLQPVDSHQDRYFKNLSKHELKVNEKNNQLQQRSYYNEQNQTITSKQSSVRFADFDAFEEAFDIKLLNCEDQNKSKTEKSLEAKTLRTQSKNTGRRGIKYTMREVQSFSNKVEQKKQITNLNFKKKQITCNKLQTERKKRLLFSTQQRIQVIGSQIFGRGCVPQCKKNQTTKYQQIKNRKNVAIAQKSCSFKSNAQKCSQIYNKNLTSRNSKTNQQGLFIQNNQILSKNTNKDQRRAKSKSTSICIRNLSKTKPMHWKPEILYQLPTASTLSSSVFKFNLSSFSNHSNNSPEKDLNFNYQNCYCLNNSEYQKSIIAKFKIPDSCKQDNGSPDKNKKRNFSVKKTSKSMLKGLDARNKQNFYIEKQHLKAFLNKK